jgi:AcrR family transcriptional regulator
MTTSPGPGHRERKKQRTREALSWAALRLAVERGLGDVRVEDIAAAAGVSPRTFNNYFSSKAEAIVWRHSNRVRRIAEELRARPADEPLWDAVTAAVLATFGTGEAAPGAEWIAGVRLMLAEDELRGEFLRSGAAAEHECAVVIAERSGADGLYPLMVAAAIGTAIRVASEQWLCADPPVPLSALLGDALDLLSTGLSTPR